jgi:hypothetical protein
MDIFNTGMAVASGKNSDDSQPLGRDPMAIVPQGLDDVFKSFLVICQWRPLVLNDINY